MGLFGKLLGIGGTLAGGALGGMVGMPGLGARIGGSIGGAIGGSLSHKKAGKQAVAAQQQSTAAQQAYINSVNEANSADFSPYVAAGGRGLGSAEGLLYGTDPNDPNSQTENLRNTPGYNFRYDEGLRALDSSAANNGSLLSGNQRIEAMKYGQGLADQNFQQAFNNRTKMAQYGLTAAGALASNRTGLASGYLQSQKDLGDTTAAQAIQRGNQNAGLIDTLTQAAGSIFEKNRRTQSPRGYAPSGGGAPDPTTGIVYPYSSGNGTI